jgi:8-hydroxy-5-deazaflavin:NADPH oxidoreductase
MFRRNTAAFIHELPPDALSYVDGDANYVRLQVLANAGALDREMGIAVVGLPSCRSFLVRARRPGSGLTLKRLATSERGVIMKIGIIGTGNIGGTLTRRLAALGHEVTVANSRGPQSLKALTDETGAKASTVEGAARDGDVVVIAVPLGAVPSLPSDALRGKVVIDADNYYPERDGNIPDIASNSVTSSEWTAAHLPDALVVKAFNTNIAEHLLRGGRPPGGESRIALPVAGDDPSAKRTVMGLVDELGFDPIDAGSLGESWRQQPNTPVASGQDLDASGVRQALASARR